MPVTARENGHASFNGKLYPTVKFRHDPITVWNCKRPAGTKIILDVHNEQRIALMQSGNLFTYSESPLRI
jgi:hypothetical protein